MVGNTFCACLLNFNRDFLSLNILTKQTIFKTRYLKIYSIFFLDFLNIHSYNIDAGINWWIFFHNKNFRFYKGFSQWARCLFSKKKSNADKIWKNQYFLNSTSCSLHYNDIKLCLKKLRKILKISGEIVFQKLLKK